MEYTKLDIALVAYMEDGGVYPPEDYVDEKDLEEFKRMIAE